MARYRDEFGEPLSISDKAEIARAEEENSRWFAQWERDNPEAARENQEAARRALGFADHVEDLRRAA